MEKVKSYELRYRINVLRDGETFKRDVLICVSEEDANSVLKESRLPTFDQFEELPPPIKG